MTDDLTTEDRAGHDHGEHEKDHWLELRVFAPRDPEERRFVFDTSIQVGAAAEQVAHEFGYARGNHTFQTSTDDVLDRTLPLGAAHLRDHQLLELVDVGGGV